MPKLFQINICLNLSTGKIAQQIGETAMSKGWESWIAYSGREEEVPSKSNVIKVGNYLDACTHYACQRLFDKEGLSSKQYTKKLIKKIEGIKPDIIHLHNIHDHWLNYPMLFDYLATLDTPVVWTQHDCWAFTGGCMYFDMLDCDDWKTGCAHCPDKRTLICNQSVRNFNLKKEGLSKIKNLTFVPVSDWLASLMKESVQQNRTIVTIHNGVDIKTFHPTDTRNKDDGHFNIIGVASTWDARKGLNDFIQLRRLLPENYNIQLVGLSESQIKKLPKGILGVSRTSNVQELVNLYNESDVLVNTTYSDNFPTVNIEALACGTPVITYKTGGSPEAIDENTGVVVPQGNIEVMAEAIRQMKANSLSREDCRKRAEDHFDKDKCFKKYIELYNTLL